MIQASVSNLHAYRWQNALKDAVNDLKTLGELLEIDFSTSTDVQNASKTFPLRVPREFIERMEKGNLRDPLLLQVLPVAQEMLSSDAYVSDPLQESDYNPLPGLLHKYKSRVLLTLAGACSVNCRYCFRREFPYAENTIGSTGFEKVLEYISQDASINEVIFSGGEPLLNSDAMLAQFVDRLSTIPHIRYLRIHTRMPIMIPRRIDASFCAWISKAPLQKVMVLHSNHPNEIDGHVKKAVSLLKEAGVTVFNQSVLLAGVNDSAETLIQLSYRLFDAGIIPYYLHLLDKVKGAEHFAVDVESAKKIYAAMQENLPGYLVPKWVCETPGAKHKVLL